MHSTHRQFISCVVHAADHFLNHPSSPLRSVTLKSFVFAYFISPLYYYYIVIIKFFFLLLLDSFILPLCLLWTLCWLGCSLFFFFWFCCCVGVVCEAGAWTAEARRCHRLSSRPCRGEDCRFLVFFFLLLLPPACLLLFLILSPTHSLTRQLCAWTLTVTVRNLRANDNTSIRVPLSYFWRINRDTSDFIVNPLLPSSSHRDSDILTETSYTVTLSWRRVIFQGLLAPGYTSKNS